MRGAALLLSAAIALPVIAAVGLPSNLFGSAPTSREWYAEANAIRIVDGETIGLGDKIVRLAGVAAPTRGEDCRGRGGEVFDCGAASAAALMLPRAAIAERARKWRRLRSKGPVTTLL